MTAPKPQFRFGCPNCNALLQVPAERVGSKAGCPWCGQVMLVPTQPAPPAAPAQWPGKPAAEPARAVTYLHHTRDAEGDVVFFFTDAAAADRQAVLQSSPVQGLRRVATAVIDRRGHGDLARYRITTEHTEYDVQMPADKADHLALELGLTLAELVAEAERLGGANGGRGPDVS